MLEILLGLIAVYLIGFLATALLVRYLNRRTIRSLPAQSRARTKPLSFRELVAAGALWPLVLTVLIIEAASRLSEKINAR